MTDAGPWHEGIAPEHQAMVDDLRRLLAWGVQVAGSVNPAYCDAVYDGCRAAVATDPSLLALVRSVHGVADAQTNAEFVAHGPTTRARLWADLSDRLQDLTGRDGPEGHEGPT